MGGVETGAGTQVDQIPTRRPDHSALGLKFIRLRLLRFVDSEDLEFEEFVILLLVPSSGPVVMG